MNLTPLACLLLCALAFAPAAAAESDAGCAAAPDASEALFGTVDCAVGTTGSAWDAGVDGAQGAWSSAVRSADALPEDALRVYEGVGISVRGLASDSVSCYSEVLVDTVVACTGVQHPGVGVPTIEVGLLDGIADLSRPATCLVAGCA